MPGAQWLTPVAYQKNLEETFTKIEKRSWQPAKLDLEKELTYFNNDTKFKSLQEYDLYFAYTKIFPLWDKRKNRDNRQFLQDVRENIYQQEIEKPIPALTSMVYGRRIPYDLENIAFRRQDTIGDFKRRRGVVTEIEDTNKISLCS